MTEIHQYFTYYLYAFININILETNTFGSLANNKYEDRMTCQKRVISSGSRLYADMKTIFRNTL